MIRLLLKKLYSKIRNLRLRIKSGIQIYKISQNIRSQSKAYRKNLNCYSHKQKWGRLTPYVNTKWYEVYTNISGVEDANYIPKDIYFTIVEPRLNDRRLVLAYADKNLYDRYYKSAIFPEVLLRNIRGIFYDAEYNRISGDIYRHFDNEDKIIIKPSLESMGGINVELFIKKDDGIFNNGNEVLDREYLNKRFKENFLIQKYITQHKFFKQFNPSSVNTVRMFTYRSVRSNDVIVLGAALRIGKEDSVVDNQRAGGIACETNDGGLLHEYALDYKFNKFYTFAASKKFSETGKIYKFDEMKDIALRIAEQNYYFRVLGLDMCVDDRDRVRIIEINNHYIGIDLHQSSGRSLFKEYTDEVIEYCLKTDSTET